MTNQNFSGFFDDDNSNKEGSGDKPGNSLSGFFDAPKKAAPAKKSGGRYLTEERFRQLAREEGAEHILPTALSIFVQESGGGRTTATSIDGARSVMQVMPATFKRMAKPGEHIDNVEDNARAGLRYLKHISKYANTTDPARLAVGYFSGEGNVNKDPNGTPWRQDRKDGNGKTVSGYAADVVRRMGGKTQGAATPQQAQRKVMPLSQAPKWADIVAKPEYAKLTPEQKLETKQAYFDHFVAPHAGAQAAALRSEFLAYTKNDEPSLFTRAKNTAGEIGGAVKNLIDHGTTGPASVLTGRTMPEPEVTANTSFAPVKPEVRAQFNAAWDAATPEARAKMQAAPGWQGQLARDRAGKDAIIDTRQDMTGGGVLNPVQQHSPLDTRAEARTAFISHRGEDPAFARRAAVEGAARGVPLGLEVDAVQKQYGTAQPSTFDFETANRFAPSAESNGFNNPIARGMAKGVSGLSKAVYGINEFVADTVGADEYAAWARGKADGLRGFEQAIGERGTYLERNLEGAINSITQQIPAMAMGIATGGTAAIPLGAMGVQSFGQEYSDGRAAGQSVGDAVQRAAAFAALEVLGEKFGLGDQIAAIKGAIKGMPSDQIMGFVMRAFAKEVPGEILTTSGQFAIDKIPGGVGLNPNAGVGDYFKQVADTIVQTVMQTGVMAGGTTGLSTAVRYARNANKSDLSGLQPAAPALGDIGQPQPQQEPPAAPPAAPAPEEAAAPAAPTPVDPIAQPDAVVESADAVVADLAQQAGVPLETVLPNRTSRRTAGEDALLKMIEARRRQLTEKRDGTLETTFTDGGAKDSEKPGRALSPVEENELAAIEAKDMGTLRRMYGLNRQQTPEQMQAPEQAPLVPEQPEPTLADRSTEELEQQRSNARAPEVRNAISQELQRRREAAKEQDATQPEQVPAQDQAPQGPQGPQEQQPAEPAAVVEPEAAPAPAAEPVAPKTEREAREQRRKTGSRTGTDAGNAKPAGVNHADDFAIRPVEITEHLILTGNIKALYKAAGVKTADAFGDLPLEQRSKAYAKYVADGGKPAPTATEAYNDKVARQEREALIRRLQSDATVRQTNGKPFKTEASAKEFSTRHELDDTHEVAKVEAGFVLKRLPEAWRPSVLKAIAERQANDPENQRQERAFARALKIGAAASDAVTSYENGDTSIEQFEAVLDAAEKVGAGDTAANEAVTQAVAASKEDVEHLFGVDKKREKALDRIKRGTAYFGSEKKAKEFITQNGLKDTHEVKQSEAGTRWDVVAKQGQEGGKQDAAVKLANATAPEHVQTGVDDRELGQIVDDFNERQARMFEGGHAVTNVFQAPAKGEVVRLNDKARVYHKDHGWMTPAEAKARIAEWKEHAAAQYDDSAVRSANSQKVVLSLFDLSGEWSRPWEEAGYQVYRFDIQNDPEMGDVNNFSAEFFGDWFGDFDGMDIYAVLAACPCTDFAVSGARHFAAKDEDGRTVASVKLVHQTLNVIEYFKPAVWAIENPVGRIEKLGGLPPWRLSFDPNHLGDPYTKKTLIWGRFNADLPVAPVDPVEGSKMHRLYGGKSMATKNARSETPQGFSYGFFMANNAHDHPAMALANKYDRLDRTLIEQALKAGVQQDAIERAVEDHYYMDLDDAAANDAIRDLIQKATPKTEKQSQAKREAANPRGMTHEGHAEDGKPINPGDVFKTASGRLTTPYPTQKSKKYASQWLIDNAVAEAQARGDNFNASGFGAETMLKGGTLPPASVASMQEYLFGQQPAVVPSILKPLVPQQPAKDEAAKPKTEKQVEANQETVKVPQAVFDALESRLRKQKERLARLRNEANKAETLEEKKASKLKVEEAESTLRRMRSRIFNAEDAAIKAIETGSTDSFDEFASLFPDAAEEVAKLVALAGGRGTLEKRQVSKPMREEDLGSMFDEVLAEEVAKDKAAEKPKTEKEAKELREQEPMFAQATKLMEEQKAATGNPKAEAAVRRKVRELAKKVQQDHKRTAAALDITATRLDMSPLQFAEQAQDEPKPKTEREAKAQRTAAEAAKSAAKNTAAGLEAAINGLGELFGGSGKLNSGLAFDEQTYAKAKPLFEQAIAHMGEAGKDVKEAMRAVVRMLLDKFGENVVKNMKPYAVQFVKDVAEQAGQEDNANTAPAQGERNESQVPEDGQRPLEQAPAANGGKTEAGGDTSGSPAGSSAERNGQGAGADGAGVQAPRSRGSRTRRISDPATRQKRVGGRRRVDADGAGVPGKQQDLIGAAAEDASAPNIPAANFKIESDISLGEGGEVTKFNDNIAAITTLKAIEAEQRRATPEEQRILARFVGWGGLASAFPNPETKEFKKGWEERGKQLQELLTPAEHRAASNSTRNAHYTSSVVVKAMWEAAHRLGYRGGLALESSMGIGNFIGLMPEKTASRFIGVEYDSLTARMAAALYPQATVLKSGFQHVPIPDDAFDLAIGNPPFGNESLRFQYRPELNGDSIHNQFFRASLASLKPGGLMIQVVSRYLMDKKDTSSRVALAREAELVASIRLPDNAFKENARTSVVTDIVILRKRTAADKARMDVILDAFTGRAEKAADKERARLDLAAQAPDWIGTTSVKDPLGGADMVVNNYFAKNPHQIIGTMERSGSMQHADDLTVRLDDVKELESRLAEAMNRLPADIVSNADVTNDAIERAYSMLGEHLGMVVAQEEVGHIKINEDGQLTRALDLDFGNGQLMTRQVLSPDSPWSNQLMLDKQKRWYKLVVKTDAEGKPVKALNNLGAATRLNVFERVVYENEADVPNTLRLGATGYAKLKAVVGLRDLLKKQLSLEADDAAADAMEGNRKRLDEAYDAFVKEYGPINRPANARLIADMPDAGLVFALESNYEPARTAAQAAKTGLPEQDEVVAKAPILFVRVVPKYEPPTKAATAADALAINLAERGFVDMERIASLLGTTPEKAQAELTAGDNPLVFLDPETNTFETANAYLSGPVRRKLLAAMAAGMQSNIKALEAVQPARWGSENVSVQVGATWVPTDIYADFLRYLVGGDVSVLFSKATNTFSVNLKNGDRTKMDAWSSEGAPGSWIFGRMLNSQTPTVTSKDADGSTYVDKERTSLAILKSREISNEFQEWIFKDAERRERLVEIFNEKFNTRVTRQYDGSHLQLPGKVPDSIIKLRRHQMNAIWRGISSRFLLIDHAVGAGKTYTGIARAMERRRMGLARKPAIVVPNHLIEQWQADVYKLYPGAKVLAASKADFEKKNRRKLFGKIATGDYDIVILPHSSLIKIGIAPETEQRYLEQELDEALAAVRDAKEQAKLDGDTGYRKPIGVKEAERLVTRIQNRMDKLREKATDRLLTFEQLGIDDLTVDEAHEFKNLFYSSRLSKVRGMGDKVGSAKAADLYNKVRVLRDSNGAVVFMTGTPVSNSVVELYTMMRYLASNELREAGIEHFDAWRTQFVDAEPAFEPDETNRLKEVTRLGRSWSNMRSMMDMYYQFTDAVSLDDIKSFYFDEHGKEFPVPKVKGGDRQLIKTEPTPEQAAMLEQVIAGFDSLDKIPDQMERNAERLRLMDRARKLSLDIRAAVPGSTSKEEGGKLERVSTEIKRIYDKWSDDKGTQLVFLDRSVPKAKGDDKIIKAYDDLIAKREKALAEDDDAKYREINEALERYDHNEIEELRAAQNGGWNAYQQIKDNLVAAGIPAGEIRFIQEANTDEQKQALFNAVKGGKVRVLIGSTPRMGAGTNVQDRLVALHHVDVTWKPSDIEQREGRIIRQGNKLLDKYGQDNFEVEVLAYATERTVDAKMWSLNATKLRAINGLRKYTGDFTMDIEDEESVSMAEMAALASGNPLLLERVSLESKINALELQEKAFRRKKFGAEDSLRAAEKVIDNNPAMIEQLRTQAGILAEKVGKVREAAEQRSVTIEGTSYTTYKDALKAAIDSVATQQAGNENARYAVNINGERVTNKAGIDDAVGKALGDDSPFEVTIDGTIYTQRTRAGRDLSAILSPKAQERGGRNEGKVGKMFGYDLIYQFSGNRFNTNQVDLVLALEENGRTIASDDLSGHDPGIKFTTAQLRDMLANIANEVVSNSTGARADYLQRQLDTAIRDLETLRARTQETFGKADELKEHRERLTEVVAELSGTGTKTEAQADAPLDADDTDTTGKYNVEAPRAKYTDDKNLQLFLDHGPDESQSGPRGVAAQREAVSGVDDLRSTENVLALALSRDYAARQRVNLVGQKVGSAEDLAILAQVYRDPRFETFRLVFVNDSGAVVSQIGLTSRLPASAAGIVGDDIGAYMKAVSTTARNHGATGFYMLHNHPSGMAEASHADKRMTREFAMQLDKNGLAFKSHVVIDTNEYSTIDRHGVSEKFQKDFGQPAVYRDAEWENAKVVSPDALMTYAKRVQAERDAITLIHTDSQFNVKAISTIPVSAVSNKASARRNIIKASLKTQGSQVFAVSRNHDALMKIGAIVQDGVHIDEKGNVKSLRQEGLVLGGQPFPSERRARVTMDSSKEFAYLREWSSQQPAQKVAEPVADYSTRTFRSMMERAQRNMMHFFGNSQKLRTFGAYHKSLSTQYHKALKDKHFGKVFNLINAMQNHVSMAAIRPAELAPGVLPRVDDVRSAARGILGEGRVQMEKVSRAIFEGTLAGGGDQVMMGMVWSDDQLRERFDLDGAGIGLYRQARSAIDASIDELAAAEAYALAQNIVPKSVRENVIDNPQTAWNILRDEIQEQIDLLKKAMEAAVEGDDTERIASLFETLSYYEDTLAKVNDVFGLALDLKEAGYAPLMRFGQYTVTVFQIDPETGQTMRDEDGKAIVEYFGKFMTQAEAIAKQKAMKAKYPEEGGYRVTSGVESKTAHEMYAGVTPETVAMFGEMVGADEVTHRYYQNALTERSALKRRLQRKGTDGYSEELSRVLSNFITSNARLAAQRYYLRDVNNAIKYIPSEKGDVKDEASNLKKFILDPSDAAAPVSTIMFAWYLGGSVAAAMVNMTQPLMMTFPYLSQFGFVQAAAEIKKAIPYAMGKREIADSDLRDALKRASQEGIVDAQEIFHLYSMGAQSTSAALANALSRIPGAGKLVKEAGARARAGQDAFLTLWGSMFSLAERFNRKMTFIAAWNMAVANGARDPYAFAVRAVNETQGIYNKVNRPNWARSSVGRTILTFKQFSIMYLEMMTRMWKHGGPEGKRAALMMLAILMLVSGEEGLPFVDDLDDLIDTIGQRLFGSDTNMKRFKRSAAHELLGKEMGDLLLYGISSKLPLDISGRLGLGNLIPGTGLLKPSDTTQRTREVAEVFGPAAGVVAQVGDAFDAIENNGVLGGAKAMAPKAVRDLAAGLEMASKGYSTDVMGRKVTDTTLLDAGLKSIGFNPTRVANVHRKSMPVQQDIGLQKKREAAIVDAWARAIVDGDDAKVNEAIAKLETWNTRNPNTPIVIKGTQIRSRVQTLLMEKEGRVLRTTPKEMRGLVADTLEDAE